MEQQPNPFNEMVKQVKGMFSFLTPQISFIVNASFAVVAFLLFILQGEYVSLAQVMFKYAGGILFFLAFLGLTLGAALSPLKSGKLSSCLNFFIIGFIFLSNLMWMKWGVITILLLVLILLPWSFFTLIKKDDKVGF